MNIAFPVWQERVSPLFDSAANLLVAESSRGQLVKQEIISVGSLSLFQRISLLEKLHIDILICGGITRPILENIRNKNIKVIPFVCGNVNELLAAFLTGRDIEHSFAMPGKSEKEN